MKRKLQLWWPEVLLVLAGGYFFFRDLGAFPAAWADDSLFMIVARRFAEGQGYSLPIMEVQWNMPFILGVGPTLIAPAALFIKIFGFSVAAARVSQTMYLIVAALLTYFYTKKYIGRRDARWAAALLITLSTFVNTGKPLLGEIPGFVFVIAALYLFDRLNRSWVWAALIGCLLGLSVITKLSNGIMYPAIGGAWMWLLVRRDWQELRQMTIVGVSSVLTLLVLSPTIGIGMELILEIHQYGLAEGGSGMFAVLQKNPELLTRFPYLYFGTLLVLAVIGGWVTRKTIGRSHAAVLWLLVALDILYFLNREGWYRHLLFAHLLLLPFVARGAVQILGRKFSVALLVFFLTAQAWWQVTYRGSHGLPEAAIAAEAIREGFSQTTMVFEQPEVYVRLPHNPHWLFITDELKTRHFPVMEGVPVTQAQHCLPLLRKLNEGEIASLAERIRQVYGRYYVVAAPADCKTH